MPLNRPALAMPKVAGYTYPANVYPDQADTLLVIPLVITRMDGPRAQTTVNETSTIPMSFGTASWGGSAVSRGGKQFRRLTVEGHINAPKPLTQVDKIWECAFKTSDNLSIPYAEYIIAAKEGRLESWQNIWLRKEPVWFRDPYDRLYYSPRLIEFTASYVEAVPFRTSFLMTMVV